MATKIQEVKVAKIEVKKDTKDNLKNYLNINMPGMFDRNPNITGDLDNFAEEIIKLIK